MQQPYFFLVIVLTAEGYELKFAIHEKEFARFIARVDALVETLTQRGYKPVQSVDAWRNALQPAATQLEF